MRNSVKIFLALFIGVILFSFKSNRKVETINPKSKVVFADTLTWKLLGEIRFQKKKHATYGEVEFPMVNTKLKKMQKKTIIMSGFVVPVDNKNYALSKNVFAACFFCGKSGPETIMGIKFKGALPKLKTDTYLTLKGTFRYNEDDAEDWIYHIENAEIISGNK
jgi:hypothetical protein